MGGVRKGEGGWGRVNRGREIRGREVLIELMHNPCVGTDSSGSVGTGSINPEFSVNSVC